MSQPQKTPHDQLDELRARIEALEALQANLVMPGNWKAGDNWLVKTTDPKTGTYPTSGPQLPVVFLEPTFSNAAGDDLTNVERSAKAQVFARSMTGYLPKDTICTCWKVRGGRRGLYFIAPVSDGPQYKRWALVQADGAFDTTDSTFPGTIVEQFGYPWEIDNTTATGGVTLVNLPRTSPNSPAYEYFGNDTATLLAVWKTGTTYQAIIPQCNT